MNWLTGLFGWKRVRHVAYVPAHPIVLASCPWVRPPICAGLVPTEYGAIVAILSLN